MSNTTIPGLYWDPKTGRGHIDKRVDGCRVFERFEARTRAEAEAAYRAAIQREQDRQAEARRPRVKTFTEAATKYLIDHQDKPSIDRDAISLAHLNPWIGALPLDQIHQGTVDRFIQARRAAGIKSSTVRRDLAILRRVLVKAARVWRDEQGRPWLPTAVPLFDIPNWHDAAEPYLLQWEEERRLLQSLPAHLAGPFLFALHTGQRSDVICSLRWDWETPIPELAATVFVVPGRPVDRYGWEGTKTRKDAVIVLNATARRVIEAARGQHPEWVFTFRGHRLARLNNTAWRNAWRAADLPTGRDILAGPHNLRHLFATRLRMAGVPQHTISTLLNHADGNITLHYSRAELRELIAAVERLEEVQTSTILRIAK